jgi:hypothetical protein
MEDIITSTYRAMLTNLKNGWTSLEDMEKLKQKQIDKENYEGAESIKRAISEYLQEMSLNNCL